jgi:hypothetical protein
VTTDARTPAERADAVARAADAAAAAAVARAPRHSDPPRPASPDDAGSAARLLAATTELEAQVARARAQLEPLDAALRQIGMPSTIRH